ncbi:TIGR04086 family membrane protein [Natranaerofaba carboxydovora]|uniref:TIGR04086 family membrane protein n=1 Tax=Natranaerofaba carboxydovora TaxID=2742683 RepID=UPI001F13703D|nr:TIGR04086 family membrane protein [Natranaerofaba carboxydovora]UMZ74016.1 hypothetical protein ACONDI_01587 [Natranaerofaba carboxydovora]
MSRLTQRYENESESKTSRISFILTGVLLAYAISLLVFLVTALLLNLTNISDVIIPHLTYITSVISIVVGSMHATKNIGEKGWLNGGVCGILYFVGLLLLSVLMGIELASTNIILSRLFMAFVFGAVGGVLGINT